jgi:hypothetical protein
MGPRRESGRAPSAEALFFHGRFQALPTEVRAIVDVTDPDLDWIIDALAAMRGVGVDVSDPAMLAIAVDAGRRRADEFAAAVESGEFARDQERGAERARDAETYFYTGHIARSVVYYARLGNRCKIGYTHDLKRRMTDIQPEELLATEPGGAVTEDQRHQQFKALRVVGEWFRYEGSLVEHVEMLRS